MSPSDSEKLRLEVERLCREHYAELCKYAGGILGRQLADMAGDVVQEAFIAYFVKAPKVEYPLLYLKGAIRYICIGIFRAAKRAPTTHDETADFPSTEEDPLNTLLNNEVTDALNKVLASLDEKDRALIEDKYRQGCFTNEQLAEKWQMPLGTLKGWLRRVLNRIESRLCAMITEERRGDR